MLHQVKICPEDQNII